MKKLTGLGKYIALAESCTAGLTADFIARVPGASRVLWGSFVVYTPDAKIKLLGVPEELLERHGPVSRSVALAMADGALEKSGAAWSVSVTGLAGPGGDASGIPTGTVWIGVAGVHGKSRAKMYLFEGKRNEVREAAAAAALEELLEQIRRDIDRVEV